MFKVGPVQQTGLKRGGGGKRRRGKEALCLFKQTDVSQQSLYVSVCEKERQCVCFAIGREWEQVQCLTYRHPLIPLSISQTPTTPSLSLFLYVCLSLCHRPRQDTLPSTNSHRLKAELLKTFSTRFKHNTAVHLHPPLRASTPARDNNKKNKKNLCSYSSFHFCVSVCVLSCLHAKYAV